MNIQEILTDTRIRFYEKNSLFSAYKIDLFFARRLLATDKYKLGVIKVFVYDRNCHTLHEKGF